MWADSCCSQQTHSSVFKQMFWDSLHTGGSKISCHMTLLHQNRDVPETPIQHSPREGDRGHMSYVCITHSEVVKRGVRQATSCNVFGQLVQHLRVLGLGQTTGGQITHRTNASESYVEPRTPPLCMHSHAWPVYCGG